MRPVRRVAAVLSTALRVGRLSGSRPLSCPAGMGSQSGDGTGVHGYGSTAHPPPPILSGMRLRRLAIEIVQTVALTILAFYLLQTFVAQPFRVEQGSMRQTLEPGQYVLADKLTAALTGYHRGDIVIFRPPSTWPGDAAGTPYIKRVIGLPGETIDLVDGVVSVNGVPIDETYTYRDGGGDGVGESGRWVLGETELLVFGDHRSNSSDSRAYGPIPTTSVIGRAVLRYFPIDLLTIITPPTYRQATP